MKTEKPDIQVFIKGRELVSVRGSELNVDGLDLYTDLVNLARVAHILTGILDTSLTAVAQKEKASPVS